MFQVSQVVFINCTDLSEKIFRILENINECFCASLYCQTQVMIPQDQSNIEDYLSQEKVLKNILKSELDSFKIEIRDSVTNVHKKMNLKIY